VTKRFPADRRVNRTPAPSIRWMVELLRTLAFHRIALRYKESLLGFGWILLQPVALTLIFTYIRRVADIPTGDIPYPLFVATGLVAWSLTSVAIAQASISITGYTDVLKRIAIPKLLLPLAALSATLADVGILALLWGGLFLYFQPIFSWNFLWVPVILGVHLLLLLGLCSLIALANVFFRDIGHAVPHLIQLWFFASPVFYPTSLVPKEFRLLARWNPMTGIIESYRSVLLTGHAPAPDLWIPAIVVTVAVLGLGLFLFWKFEGILADLI